MDSLADDKRREQNARNRARYANDPAYRAKKIAAAQAEYVRKRDSGAAGRVWRQKRNKARAAKQNELKARVRAIKNESPCTDCGVSYPSYVMDFDHVRGKKVERVARLIVSGTWAAIEAEIAKCELVCANCHRERTAQRL